MAIFHSSSQVISRSKGKSSVASSAYRSGEKIIDERTGLIHDFRRKKGVVYSNILVPQNAPEWTKKREILWNEVGKIEKRKDSQLAREINLALPIELNREEQIKLLENYTKENFVDNGMIADIVIHDIGVSSRKCGFTTLREIKLVFSMVYRLLYKFYFLSNLSKIESLNYFQDKSYVTV